MRSGSKRRRWKRLCLLSGVLMIALTGAAYAGPGGAISSQRQQELMNLLKHDCGSCHGLTMKGGLGSPLLPARFAATPAEALAEVILDGLPGTPMPPWRPLLSEADAVWLAQQIKTGVSE
jgi:cytochrome c55X